MPVFLQYANMLEHDNISKMTPWCHVLESNLYVVVWGDGNILEHENILGLDNILEHVWNGVMFWNVNILEHDTIL